MALITAGVEMRDTVCACSAGILDTTIVSDLTQNEENAYATPPPPPSPSPSEPLRFSCDGHIVVAAMPKSSFICHVNSGPKVTVDKFLGVLQVRLFAARPPPVASSLDPRSQRFPSHRCYTFTQAATEGCAKLGASFRVELLQLTSSLINLQVTCRRLRVSVCVLMM
jgi:hypothetical protein